MESLSDKNTIWQIDEIILILVASGRFHNLTDFVLLTEIFERLFPEPYIIGFKRNKLFISRQIESLKKKKYVFAIGNNVGISSQGRKYAINILNKKILQNEKLTDFWKLYRKILTRLPRVRRMWEGYLENFLENFNK
ncbi:MAG: hypothetical protein ACFFD2_12380 [Promethearchaeota archaeon]